MIQSDLSYPKEHMRYAMLSFFLAQGLCFSSWASRIPDVKDIFSVSDTLYWGMILLMIPIGKFIAIPLAGYLVSKLGSKIIVQISILGYAFSLFTIGVASNIYILGGCLFFFGVFWNLCDISLNTQAIGIERLYGKTIMASFHAGWSLAACLGAIIGFIMIVSGVKPFYHFSMILIVLIVIVIISRKYLQNDAPIAKATEEQQIQKEKKGLKMPELLLLQLGLVGLFALIVESAMFDWSGVYFEDVLNVPKSLQIGFLVFMIMMTLGRFLTNWAYRLCGKKLVVQIAGIFIFVGFFTAAFLGDMLNDLTLKVIVNSIGFMFVGLGISCIVPTIYSVVGEKSKTPTGIALTILSSISFVGSLVAPPLIGAISKELNMRYAYLLVGLLGLCIFVIVTVNKAFDDKKSN